MKSKEISEKDMREFILQAAFALRDEDILRMLYIRAKNLVSLAHSWIDKAAPIHTQTKPRTGATPAPEGKYRLLLALHHKNKEGL